MLALRQPAASDLRFITTALKIVTDLERMGDLAVNIAKRAKYLSAQPRLDVPIDFTLIAEKAQASCKQFANPTCSGLPT